MFRCPHCGNDLIVLKSDTGKEALCPECLSWTEVPVETVKTEKPCNCKIRIKPQNEEIMPENRETADMKSEATENAEKPVENDTEAPEAEKDNGGKIYTPESEHPSTSSARDDAAIEYNTGHRMKVMSFREFLELVTPRIYVTIALIAINAIVFIVMALNGVSIFSPQADQLIRWGAKVTPLVLINNEWWRLATSVFIHIGLLHFAVNMWALWYLGILAERLFGNIGFLTIYLVSGFGGSVASLYFNPVGASAGASGAIFGIVGALIAFFATKELKIPQQISRRILLNLLIIVGINLVIGFSFNGIDNAGHIGGLLTGLGAGFFLRRRLPPVRAPRRYLRYLGVAGIAAYLLITLLTVSPFYRNNVLPAEAVREYFEKGQYIKALEVLEQHAPADKDSQVIRSMKSVVYGNAGWEYYLKGDFSRCIELSKKAVDLDPVVALYAHYNIALCYLRMERFEEARRLYSELENGEIKLEKTAHDGAVGDLVDLVRKGILAGEARAILTDIFGLSDEKINDREAAVPQSPDQL